MKKILVAFIILLIVCVAGVYVLIPSTLIISEISTMPASISGVYRFVGDKEMWPKWLKDSSDATDKNYTITNSFLNTIDITVFNGKDSLKSKMSLFPIASDSALIQWQCDMPSGSDPFARISSYNHAVQLKKDMKRLMHYLKTFTEKDINIYGLDVHESSIKDTLLISTQTDVWHYPSTQDIYALIDKLKSFAAKSNLQVTGYPMYNVTAISDDTMRLMTALPVNKEVREQAGSVSPVRMVPGRFLITQVTGGTETVKNAFVQMRLYFADHNRTSMAIPFAYLVTDRTQETDTSKWITKIYCPVY
jgi:hypothetical protein